MTAASRADKKEAFAAALAESLADSGATTPKGGGRGKAAAPGAVTAKPVMPRPAAPRVMPSAALRPATLRRRC